MIEKIFTIIFIGLISFIPILIWGYLFSYFDDSKFNRNRFLIGIFAGGLSVIPVLYLGDFISKTKVEFLNIFSYIHSISTIGDIPKVILSFFGVLFLISLIPFLTLYFTNGIKNYKDKLMIFLKNFLIFCLYLILIGFIFYILNIIFQKTGFDKDLDIGLNFGTVLFNSTKLVIFYYLIIGILEELSKFFCFNYSPSLQITSVRQGVLYAIFIALGFAFIENILYFKSMYENHSFGKELIGVYFSRNIFSVVLHSLCSSIFAYFFSKAYLMFKYKLNINFIKIIFIGFITSIILHSLFDIFLTFNITFMVIVYLLGTYFYLSYIFYKD